MITLHHLEYSQSFRVLWLLEELGIEYELKSYDRDPNTRLAPSDYKKVSPLGTAPVISDGDVTLAESNAIIDYILDKYPSESLRPGVGDSDRARYLFWFHASQGSMMPLLLMEAVMRVMHSRVPFLLKSVVGFLNKKMNQAFSKPRMQGLLKQAELDLAQADWFGGHHLTAADISMIYPMEGAESRGYINDNFPNCQAWLKRAKACPSFKRATEKDNRPSMIMKIG